MCRRNFGPEGGYCPGLGSPREESIMGQISRWGNFRWGEMQTTTSDEVVIVGHADSGDENLRPGGPRFRVVNVMQRATIRGPSLPKSEGLTVL